MKRDMPVVPYKTFTQWFPEASKCDVGYGWEEFCKDALQNGVSNVEAISLWVKWEQLYKEVCKKNLWIPNFDVDYIHEFCSVCENEVIIPKELAAQTCPICGVKVEPCSICPEYKNEDCILDCPFVDHTGEDDFDDDDYDPEE